MWLYIVTFLILLISIRWWRTRAIPIDSRGRWVLVTGAAGGLGLEICGHLLRRGCRVVATDLQSALPKLHRLFVDNANVKVCELDVADDDSMHALKARLQDDQVSLWGLCSNAGILPVADMRLLVEEDVQRAVKMVQVNSLSLVRLMATFSTQLIAARGALVVIGSISARLSPPYTGLYPATKAFLSCYVDSLRRELLVEGIPLRVSIVEPSSIQTPLTSHLTNPKLHDAALDKTIYPESIKSVMRLAKKSIRTPMPASAVARAVVDRCLLNENNPSHLVIDHNHEFWFLLNLPYDVVDFFFGLARWFK